MPKRPRSLKDLTDAFERLGVEEPESWARSEVEQGINQLGRAMFLKDVWRAILDERDTEWLKEIEKTHPSDDHYGMEASARRILEAGADPADLLMVIREFQFRTAYDICYTMSSGSQSDIGYAMGWTLVEFNSDTGELERDITALHESLANTDPTGLEMEPLRAQLNKRSSD